jgi:tetratricopeptide (TPR) repeat protein
VISRLLAGAAVLAAAVPAHAAWQKASSAHFVIYADETPDKLRDFATRLEKFDKAVRQVRAMADPPMGDGNRLTVFVVPTIADVQKLATVRRSGMTPNLAGFYTGRAEGSIAVVPKRSNDTRMGDFADQETFFHEYAHHLMFYDLSVATPLWYSEGFAEFMSTAGFGKDGSVTLGRPVLGRAYGVDDKSTFPLERMLASNDDKLSEDEWSALYARGWILTHYLTFEATRKGQIERYLQDFSQGKDSLQAAQAAFGDFKTLDRNLHGYVGRSRISIVRVAGEALPVGPVSVEALSAGGSEMMPLRTRLKIGVPDADALALAQGIRAVAAKYPSDPLVQATLAEAEQDAHQYPAAEAAADRALTVNPKMIEAMIFKGRAIMERAAQGEKGATFAAARGWFMKANKLDAEDPEPLMLFHEAQIRDTGRPTANGIAALHYASDLAPQDLGLRMQSALQYLRDGKLPEARKALAPVAFNPHGGSIAKTARSAMEKIDAGDAKGAEKTMFGN